MRFLYFALAFYSNADISTHITLRFFFHFGKFGVLFTDYGKIFSKFDHHICKKGTWSVTNTIFLVFSDSTQDKKTPSVMRALD